MEIPGPGMFVFCLQINRIAIKAPDSLQWTPVREVSKSTAVSTINHRGNFSSVLTVLCCTDFDKICLSYIANM